MAAYQGVFMAQHTRELRFAGDGVSLAGQIDYPAHTPPQNGFPLIFVLHHAGCNSREDYQHYADAGLQQGYAVFRWDKRGTGRSGAGGRGSTTQDAVNAYETALEQPHVNRKLAYIIAQGGGTRLLGSAFGLFARVQMPKGVVLVGNRLTPEEVLAITTRLHIIHGTKDWNDWRTYGEEAAKAHKNKYRYGTSHFICEGADKGLYDADGLFHNAALQNLSDWLANQWAVSSSI
ncbi:MAG: hypothetical protein D6712_20540 [Chloroflexi bacterium]|nr:MAG: hypothetical protein D6712_20540 [Chloroflexota bacterium]